MARIPRGLITEMRRVGLTVVEVAGCWGRGTDSFNPIGVIAHATAGNRTATDQGELNVILYGSNTAPPPISQFMLGRTGVWYFVADGRCNHVRNGFGGTTFAGLGNGSLIGVEGCNNNIDEPWHSYAEYVTGMAVICNWYGWSPYSLLRGHKEHQPGDKSDPTFNVGVFRNDVYAKIQQINSSGPIPKQIEDDDMLFFAPNPNGEGNRWAYVSGGRWFEYNSQPEGTALALGAGKNFSVLDNAVYTNLRQPFLDNNLVLSG